MPPYSYTSLRHNDSIRVIELYPGASDDPLVHCNITRRRLSEPMLRYEGISYTWGNPLDRETIFCGGNKAELLVTRNCYNALRNLRRVDKPRTIWIDAICINQSDIPERSSQVAIMDRIYATAFRVIAYLGEETPGSRLLFAELSRADSMYQSQGTSDSCPVPNDEVVRELDELFCRPWFSRIWVIQEVYVAKEVVMMCGTSHSSMAALNDCTFGYLNNHRVTKSLVPIPIRPELLDTSYHGMEGFTGPAIKAWVVLIRTRHCEATDPRDKIFALKAILNWKELERIIDYSQSVEKVFSAATMLLLPSLKLRLLLAVRHPHTLEMPSWMPDWSRNMLGDSFVDSVSSEKDFTVCCFECTHNACNNKHAVLSVQGIQHSRISHLGASFNFEGPSKLCYQPLQHIVQQLVVPDWSLGPTHTCGNLCHDIIPLPIHQVLQGLSDQDKQTIIGRGLLPLYNADESGKVRLTWGQMEDVKVALHNTRIFLTEDGTIGIGPKKACEGDVLCVLKGSFSPSILRRKSENSWTLVSGEVNASGELDYLSDDTFGSDDLLEANKAKMEEFLIW